MDKEYNSPNIESIMNKVTLYISKQYVINYLVDIFKTLSNENNKIELITFFNYMKLPYFICKKIFFSYSKNNVLNSHSFLKLFCGLYLGNFLDKITNIFYILDFNHDKIIQLDDVKLLLYNFHIINKTYSNESDLYLLDNSINNFFSDKKSLSFEEYLDIIKNKNSDIIFILILIFYKYIPFTEYEIHILINTNSQKNTNKKLPKIELNEEDIIEIFPPTKNVFIYSETVLGINNLTYQEEINDDELIINELNQIENDWKNIKKRIQICNNNNSHLNKSNSTIHLNFYDIRAKSEKNDLSQKVINKSSSFLKKLHVNSFEFNDYCKISFDKNTDKFSKYDLLYYKDIIFLFKVYVNELRTFKILDKIIILKKVLYLSIQNKSSIIINYIIKKNPEYIEIEISNERKANKLYNLILSDSNYRKIDQNYISFNKIAKGNYGEVILSKKKDTDEIYAVKIINKKYSQSLKEQSPIYWEMDISKLLININSDYIIKIYDTFESVDHCYIVMEYLKDDLYTFIYKNHIDDKNKLLIIKQLSESIYTLRKFGIIHRDLKLENIGIINHNNNFKIKLFDFGLSKIIGNYEKTNETYGSLFYFTPEVLKREYYDYKIDMWPFGIIVYYLMFKKFPFEDKNTDNETQTERVKYFIQKLSHINQIKIDEKNVKNKEQLKMIEIIKKTLIKDFNKRCDIHDIISILKSS